MHTRADFFRGHVTVFLDVAQDESKRTVFDHSLITPTVFSEASDGDDFKPISASTSKSASVKKARTSVSTSPLLRVKRR